VTEEPRDRAGEPGPGGADGQDRADGPGRADAGGPGPDESRQGPPRSGPSPRNGPPPGQRPHGGRPAGRPYGGKPAGPYRAAGSRAGPPPGQRPYGGRPPGRPYGGKPTGRSTGPRPPERPDDRPYRRDDRPDGGGGRGPGPRRDGPPPERRQYDGPPRQVEYGHRDRRPGPPPSRGQWGRASGPRAPRGDWERRDRPTPARALGPVPVEMLAEDEEVVAGRRPVEEAFAARREARRLLVVPERRAALDQLVLHATTLRIPVVEVEGGTITAISGFDGHQGIALVVAPRRWATLDEVLALAKARHEPPFLLALDHLEDPQNVGTLLRSAEACGVHGVMFPTRGAAPISPAAIKTSAGAVEHLLLVPMPDLAAGLVELHTRGVRVIGADGDASMTVREVDMRGPIVIVTGSEGRGLNAKVRKRVDLMARIPMRGKVASLNASVAGSVFLFEAAAQRDIPEADRRPQDLAADELAAGEPAALDEPTAREPAGTAERSGLERASGMPGASGRQGVTGEGPEGPSRREGTPALAEPGADDLLPEAPPARRPDEPT
jgi:23S rRNA (guanosine2251-2'-O)-methyltransferase